MHNNNNYYNYNGYIIISKRLYTSKSYQTIFSAPGKNISSFSGRRIRYMVSNNGEVETDAMMFV